MFERYGVWVLALGALSILAGWIWLTIRAFGEKFWWGLGTLLFAPIGAIFACFHWKREPTRFSHLDRLCGGDWHLYR